MSMKLSFREIIAEQLNLFFLALSFFSRIPVPKSVTFSPSQLNQSSRYFSLVGIVLAAILTLFFTLVSQYFSLPVSVLLLMVASLMLTGAFHEDGLADMTDGIGGGFTVESRLTIMKDSRVGTYGVVSLLSVLALKFSLLIELAQLNELVMAIITAYGLSRAIAGSLIFDMPYVSDAQSSKSKPLAEQQSLSALLLLLLIGVLPLFYFSLNIMVSCLVCLALFRFIFKKWLISRIGGFTGDCLGAAQQIAELIIYLVIVFFVSSPQLSVSEYL